MSHRSRRPDDRDHRSHSSSQSSQKYDKHEYRHHRDDSRDRSDRYHSKKTSRRDSRYRSRSRSPSHNSRRHHRSRSRSHGRSSRHYYDDSRSRSHRSNLPDSKSRHDSREHSQTKHYSTSHDKYDGSHLTHQQKTKYDSTSQSTERGPPSISHSHYTDSDSNDNASKEPKDTNAMNDLDAALEEEKQRIQKETLKRLQKHLEKEGKAYPPPKPQASHPIFANDGSFLEMFKSMQGNLQQQQQPQQQINVELQPVKTVPTTSAANPISRLPPIKRRGPKILKTGMVQKQRVTEETEEVQATDSWNAYLKEVKRYKTVTCSDDNMTRSLVK